MKKLSQRLRALMDDRQITQQKLAAEIGVSHPSVSNWLGEKVNMPRSIAMAIQAAFGVRWQWLLDGEGSMYLAEQRPLSETENELLLIFRECPAEYRETLVENFRGMLHTMKFIRKQLLRSDSKAIRKDVP